MRSPIALLIFLIVLVPACNRNHLVQETHSKEKEVAQENFTEENVKDLIRDCNILYREGKLTEALLKCEKAHDFSLKMSPQIIPLSLRCMNDLGVIYSALGRYSEAEQLILKTLDVYRKNDRRYASGLHNLADIYYNLGDYEKAEEKYIRSIDLKKKYFSAELSLIARSKNGLAQVYIRIRDYDKAAYFFKKAIKLWRKSERREDMLDLAKSLSSVGVLYEKTGYTEEAKIMYLESISIFERFGMTKSYNYAISLNNLASIYHRRGIYAQTESLYRDVLEIMKISSGDNNPRYVAGLTNLSILFFQGSRFADSRKIISRALPIIENHIQDTFAILTERQRMSFVKNNRHYFDWYLTLFNRKGDEKDAYNHFLKWKGVVLNSMKAQKEFLDERAAKDPEFRKKLDEYQDILHYQSMLLTKGALNEHEREELERATKKREELERDFAREDASYRQERELQKITVDNICSVLKPDEAIVDYLKYTKRVLKKGEEKNDIELIDSYLAFIVRGGKDCSNLVRIELGKAKDIEKLTDGYRRLFENPEEKVNDPTDPEGISFELMKKIWRPLEEHLGDRKKVWIIPDGALGGVSFQTLQTDKDEYLIDKYDIRYLDNSADLYRAAVIKKEYGRKTALFAGNIDFGKKEKTDDKCFPTDMEELYDETGAVRNLLKQNKIRTTVYEKNKATRPAVFEGLRSSPGIVHISTHGFYLPEECVTRAPVRQKEDFSEIRMAGRDEKVEADPMSRSGIVFAGVNDPEQREHAIATGIDFSGLNLRETELFVLSACQSGMGGMTEGEGVVGMRRALSMAGVRTVISTLWDAEDEITKQIMKEFYEGYLKTGKPHETMRAIQKKYREKYPDRYLLWGFLAVSGAVE